MDPLSLVDAAPKRNCGAHWPLPVDERLNALVASAQSAGAKTTRSEILAALVCAADSDGDKLSEVLLDYRLTTVAEALDRDFDDENIVSLHRHKHRP